jgi:hypothetical protein
MGLIFSTTASSSDFDALVNKLSPEEIELHGVSVLKSGFKAPGDSDWLTFKSYGQLESGKIRYPANFIYSHAVEAGEALIPPKPAQINLSNIFAASDGEYRAVPLELLQKMLFDENRKPVSLLAKDIIYGLSRLYEQSKKYAFLGNVVLAGLISQEILAGKPLPEKDFEELNNKALARMPKHFQARVNLPENVKAALLKLHEGLKPLSLWADAQTTSGHSASHDVGMDMALSILGHDGSQHYNRRFGEKAAASALQLRVSQIVGIVNYEVPMFAFMIQHLPEPIRPYFGFNTQRDLSTSMAFGSSTPGRFESGVTRRVFKRP